MTSFLVIFGSIGHGAPLLASQIEKEKITTEMPCNGGDNSKDDGVYNCSENGKPSFNCKKAKTDIEKAICDDADLGNLDYCLSIVYKKALKITKNPKKIKSAQIKWLRGRNKIVPDERGYSNESLMISYINRFFDLFEDRDLRTFFLNKFMSNPLTIGMPIVALASMSLWKETSAIGWDNCTREDESGDDDWRYFIAQLSRACDFIQFTKNKFLLSLSKLYAYSWAEYFFMLEKSDGVIKIQPFSLPQPKDFTLFLGKNGNCLGGNSGLESKNGQHFLHHNTRPCGWQHGDSCVWQLDEHGAKVIKEQQRDRDDSKPAILDKKVLLGTWKMDKYSQRVDSSCNEDDYPYDDIDLKFINKNEQVICQLDGIPKDKEGKTDSKRVKAIDSIVKGPEPEKTVNERCFFVKKEKPGEEDRVISIELLNKNTLKVMEGKDHFFGEFDGVYIREK